MIIGYHCLLWNNTLALLIFFPNILTTDNYKTLTNKYKKYKIYKYKTQSLIHFPDLLKQGKFQELLLFFPPDTTDWLNFAFVFEINKTLSELLSLQWWSVSFSCEVFNNRMVHEGTQTIISNRWCEKLTGSHLVLFLKGLSPTTQTADNTSILFSV